MDKLCSRCKEAKPLTEFFKNKKKSQGVDSWCKKCSVEYHRNNELGKLKARNRFLRRKYGITDEEYEMLLKLQKQGCKICGTKSLEGPKKRLAIDHCHKTNTVRGILCEPCNRALGLFKDSIPNLQRAIFYLELSRDL